MYLAKMRDGSYQVLEDLDPNNPPTELLQGVEEVYVISKVLVPTITLRPKSKEERGEIKDKARAKVKTELEPTQISDPATAKRKRGPNKGKA